MNYNFNNILPFLPLILTLFIVIGFWLYFTIPNIIEEQKRQYYSEVRQALKKGYHDGSKKGKEIQRKRLLKKAKQFLAPYKSIWQNQLLTNEKVKLRLKKKVLDLYDEKKKFRYEFQKKEDINLIWNYVLDNFSENDDYNTIKEFIDKSCLEHDIKIISYLFEKKSIQKKFIKWLNKERTVDI